METERAELVLPITKVPAVIEGEIVTTIRALAQQGVGKRRIAAHVGASINTVRRYVREVAAPGVQVRPAAQRLTGALCADAQALYAGPAEGNAVVVRRLLGVC